MRLGAHVRTAGGVDKAVDRAEEMGAETIQVFIGAPQALRCKNDKKAAVETVKARLKETVIGQVFVQGLRRINFGTDIAWLLKKPPAAPHPAKRGRDI